MASRCGYSVDLSGAINDRAMFHADNAYFLPAATITTKRMKTNTVSNTAFRGFGGPQGMMVAERMIDEIAWALDLDPLDVRKRNLYREGRDVTPYGMVIEDNILPELIDRCEVASDYRRRRRQAKEFNAASATLKRGIALTPVKFGISFTTTHLNQAGALVHVYQDGSIHLNHGGTEMGQGLYIKVAQVVAEEFGVDAEAVKITATTTAKVPNTSATAASSGSDINGMAAKNAAGAIKARLIAFAAESYDVDPRPDRVPRQPRVHRQPLGAVRRPDQAGLFRARVAVVDRLLQDAEDPLGCRRPGRAGRSTISPTGRRAPRCWSTSRPAR